jgi:hypothetical protein
MPKRKADPKKDDKAEAERRQLEMTKASVVRAIDNVQRLALAGNAGGAERAVKQAQEVMKNPKLPRDFMQIQMARLKKFELETYVKATDMAIRSAMQAALSDDREARNKFIGEAKTLMQKAVSLKAPPEFKAGCMRQIEAVTLSGGMKHDKPTRAKPLDNTERVPDRAHMSDAVDTLDRAHMADRVETPDRAHVFEPDQPAAGDKPAPG